ncbi:MAG: acyltransferase family protein, partial [Janthinobacterium lividum]
MTTEKNQNNLNIIRLLAATGVLVSHSFPLISGSDSSEPLFIFSHGQTTIGHCAVIIFFAISGYLITTSYLKSQSKPRFVLARLLRLLPGLAAVLVVLAFLLGPQVSTLTMAGYFGSWAPYHYVLGNLSLVAKFQDHLPSVFLDNPFAGAVNGSLWTLQYEVGCYGAVLLLGLVGALRWPVI